MATRKFKISVVTPHGDKFFYSHCSKMQTLKATINRLRSQMHYGYSVSVEGPKNNMTFTCFAPMTDEAVVKTLELIPALRKRLSNLKTGKIQIIEPPAVPTERTMRTILSEQLRSFNERVNELVRPAPKREMSLSLFTPKSKALIPFEGREAHLPHLSPLTKEALLKKQREMFPYAARAIDHYQTGDRSFPKMESHPTMM